MLDVHPPHEKMHGFGDFLLHLLTITVGLLIAVGIEGAVEWRHHRHLANEARETMRTEIEQNVKKLDGALAALRVSQHAMQQNVDAMTRIQRDDKNPAYQHADLHGGFNLTGLEDTAWHTAQATGALAWMPYDEAERFSSVYNAQQAFEVQQEKIQQDSSLFLGLIRRVDPDKGHLASAEAGLLNERFGVWQGDLLLLDLSGRLAAEEEHSLLEGRPMRTEMHEGLNN